MNKPRSIAGATILEAILALVIASALIVLGLKTYNTFSTDSAAQQVKYNVENIIRSAANYYYANCQTTSSNTPTDLATLDPSNNPSNPYALTVTSLVDNGYLDKAPPINPLVSSGYIIQFNLTTPTKYFCTDAASSSSCKPIGTSYVYTIQVSVPVQNSANASSYLAMTGADCLTSLSGTNVVSCAHSNTYAAQCITNRTIQAVGGAVGAAAATTANNLGCPNSALQSSYNNYLSWERLPSMASPKGQSGLWLSNPVIKQFKQDLEHRSIPEMLNDPTSKFLCGS